MENGAKKQEVMALWCRCFEDTEDFVHWYFEKKYRDENALLYRNESGKAVSAVQMIPYPMTFAGETIRTSYISGACTLPEERKKGRMRQLLKATLAESYGRGELLSILIPQEEWLFSYYKDMGYATVFGYTPLTVELPGITDGRIQVKSLFPGRYDEDLVYAFFKERMGRRNCCVQHDREDFSLIAEDLHLSGGVLMAAFEGALLVGLAFVLPENQTVSVRESLFDSEGVKYALAKGISACWPALPVIWRVPPEADRMIPNGMARIVNAERMLQIYAAFYPEKIFGCELTDSLIPRNSGTYLIEKGEVRRQTGRTDQADYFVCDIETLTCLLLGYDTERLSQQNMLFERQQPFMSLMLE